MARYKSDMMGRTWLYRAYDLDGRLLYVGITKNLEGRLTRHRYKSEWWQHVAAISHQEFATRSEAFRAESVVIRDEDPIYNKARQGGAV